MARLLDLWIPHARPINDVPAYGGDCRHHDDDGDDFGREILFVLFADMSLMLHSFPHSNQDYPLTISLHGFPVMPEGRRIGWENKFLPAGYSGRVFAAAPQKNKNAKASFPRLSSYGQVKKPCASAANYNDRPA